MKLPEKSSILLVLATLTLVYCTPRDPKSTLPEDVQSVLAEIDHAKSEMEDFEEVSKKLLETVPMTSEEMEQVIPASLLGLEQVSVFAYDLGYGMAGNATYQSEDKEVSLSITDCAGADGKTMYAMHKSSLANYGTEYSVYESDSSRIVINGEARFIEHSMKRGEVNLYIITTLVNNRYLVKIESKKKIYDQLYKAFTELDLSGLTF